VELVLVLGLDIDEKTKLCEELCASITSAGRNCQHLQTQALLKAEAASGSDLGADILPLLESGKTVPQQMCASVIKSALASAPGGVYLLEGYPASAAAFESMPDDVGVTPRLALLLEMSDEIATAKLNGAAAKLQVYKIKMDALSAELQKKSLLHKLDASEGINKPLAVARSLIDSTTRGVGSGAGGEASGFAGRIVLVMGGPGAGKATHCARLASKYGCVHLCIEKLMRGEVRDETETGRAIAEMVKGGKIVPAHLYLALLKDAMLKHPGAACLLDGFPRSVDNLALLESQLGSCTKAVFFEASEKLLEERLIARGLATGRADDQPEAAKRRIRTFKNQASDRDSLSRATAPRSAPSAS
jgi:UMP-CMP kinase